MDGCENVLDLRCGNNSPLKYIFNGHYTGVDIHYPYLLENISNGRGAYVHGDIRKLMFKSKSFDAVTLLEVLEHMIEEEGRELLKKAEDIARKKNYLNNA